MLILLRNGEPVTYPFFFVGADFYYTDGKIGITAQDGWTYAQQLLEAGTDGEPVVVGIVNWSVEAVPVDEPIPPTPEQIRAAMPTLSPVQFRKMLRGQGISAAMVEAAIATIADEDLRADAADAWEYATYFELLNPLIDMIGAALGLTPADIDAAWLGAVDA